MNRSRKHESRGREEMQKLKSKGNGSSNEYERYEKIKPEMCHKSRGIIRRSVNHFFYLIYHITAAQACEPHRFSRIQIL